jgi:hypothetical protein
MRGIKEIFFILSVVWLHVAGFLQSGNQNDLIAGDNVILLIGLFVIFATPELRKIKLSSTILTAFTFGVVVIVISPLYTFLKDALVFEKSFEIVPLMKASLRLFIVYNFVKYLSINFEHFYRGISALLYFGVVIVLSMLFLDIFGLLGFYTYKIGTQIEGDFTRISGITGMSVNVTGILLSMLFGIALTFFKYKVIGKYKFLFLAAFYLIGILLTGSRTALYVTFLIYFVYLLSYFKHMRPGILIFNLFAIVVLFVVFSNFAEVTLARIEQGSEGEYGGLEYRMGYWEFYLNDIADNPEYLIHGNTAPPTYKRSPHNYYVYLAFSSGLFFLLLPLYIISRFVISKGRLIKRSQYWSLESKYILIPQLLFWLTALEPITWFGLIMLMASGIFFEHKTIEKFSAEN